MVLRQHSLRLLRDTDLALRMDYGDCREQDEGFTEWGGNRELEGRPADPASV